MSLQTPGLAVEIAISNMDLYPIDLPGRASWGSDLEQLAAHLEKTGCCDFEVVPTKAIMQAVANCVQRGDTDLVDSVIGSVHQSFSGGKDILGHVADWRGVHRSGPSIARMGAIAAAVGRPISAVYYPDNLPGNGVAPTNDFCHNVMQPCAEIYRDFGVYGNVDLLQVMSRLGISGLCPDTIHARRQAEDSTKPPSITSVWADQFASGYVYQMHVGADRVDMRKRDPKLAAKSAAEFRAFTSHHWQDALNTEMGDMITAAIENWVPPAALLQTVGRPILRQVIEMPPRPQAILNRVKHHARFAENLAEIAREAGATPLY